MIENRNLELTLTSCAGVEATDEIISIRRRISTGIKLLPETTRRIVCAFPGSSENEVLYHLIDFGSDGRLIKNVVYNANQERIEPQTTTFIYL